MNYKPGHYSEAVAAQQYNDKKLRKASQKMESITLKELGKYSAFQEYFEGIILEEQDFSHINKNRDITTNPSFVEERNFGFTLIKKGFNLDNYRKYINATESIKHR